MSMNEKPRKYIVLRNGFRVSDKDYYSRDEAKSEYDFWKRVITRWPDGSYLEIPEKR